MNWHVKVTIDGPRSEVVHDFVVQYEVCLKTPTFKGVKLIKVNFRIELRNHVIHANLTLIINTCHSCKLKTPKNRLLTKRHTFSLRGKQSRHQRAHTLRRTHKRSQTSIQFDCCRNLSKGRLCTVTPSIIVCTVLSLMLSCSESTSLHTFRSTWCTYATRYMLVRTVLRSDNSVPRQERGRLSSQLFTEHARRYVCPRWLTLSPSSARKYVQILHSLKT